MRVCVRACIERRRSPSIARRTHRPFRNRTPVGWYRSAAPPHPRPSDGGAVRRWCCQVAAPASARSRLLQPGATLRWVGAQAELPHLPACPPGSWRRACSARRRRWRSRAQGHDAPARRPQDPSSSSGGNGDGTDGNGIKVGTSRCRSRAQVGALAGATGSSMLSLQYTRGWADARAVIPCHHARHSRDLASTSPSMSRGHPGGHRRAGRVGSQGERAQG